MAERPSLSDAQRFAWLRLIRTPRIGPSTFRDLINLFGSAEAALDGVQEMTARRGRPIRPADPSTIRHEMEAALGMGARFVAAGEPGYPRYLAKVDRPPPLLCVLMASSTHLPEPAIALVGARNASAAGRTLAARMAGELGEAGYAVHSGLARGIDAAAHEGALETGTAAFLAGGLDRPYPPEHESLLKQIVDQGGAAYSEMPMGWAARSQDFPRRNRLVAGSSLGLVVVEAARRSGSLITAGQAADLGRAVMAVPGFPLDPRSEGPNQLLRDGATLVRDARDVVEEVAPLVTSDPFAAQPVQGWERPATSPRGHLTEGSRPDSLPDDGEAALMAAMSVSPVAADDLIASTGLPTALVRAWLVEMELADRLVRYPGDRFAWNPSATQGEL